MFHGDLTISVVICAYTEERWEDLKAAVNSVKNQRLAPSEIILVIDHNPALLSRAQAGFSHITVIENREKPGLSGARNTALAVARSEIIAFLDDDAIAAPDWLACLVAGFADPQVMGVGGAIDPLWLESSPAWFPPEFGWVIGCTYRGMPGQAAPVRNLIGCNMAFRREIFEVVGGFRSEIGRVGNRPLGCEETELCIRAHQQWPTKKFLYQPQAHVSHRVSLKRATWKYFQARCYSEGLSKAQVARLVGTKDGLAAERTYLLRTLPQGVAEGIFNSLRHHSLSGLAQAEAIVAGLMLTFLGYLVGRLTLPFKARQSALKPDILAAKNSTEPTPRPLRVLMVTPRYFPYTGGSETHVYETARRLALSGSEVTVLTTDPGGKLATEEVLEGVHIRRVRAWPARKDYYFAPSLYRIITRGDWDVIHCQSYHTLVAPLAMFAAIRAKIPFVITFHSGGHSSRFRNALRGLQCAALRPLLTRATRLVGVSQFEVDFFREKLKLPAERFVVIPNGAQLPALEPETETNSSTDEALIVSIGRLERYKGHHRVIAALPKVLETHPKVRLRIVGNGPYEAKLQRQVQRLGLNGKVEIGAIPSEERVAIAQVLSKARLVTLLSDYEAHPVAVMEALSLRRPVLVTATAGLRELAEQGLVQAVPRQSKPAQIAAAILKQFQQPVAQAELELPTWEKCAANLLTLYRGVSGRPVCES